MQTPLVSNPLLPEKIISPCAVVLELPAADWDYFGWLLGEMIGEPNHHPVFSPSWRTPDVNALCSGVYEGLAFDRLPILADALEDAGCADDVILSHLRSSGPHVRGCWALDLILGKS